MVGWFFVLILAGEWIIIQLASVSSILKIQNLFPISYREILEFALFIFTGIAYASSLNNLVKARKLVWYFSQPMPLYKIFFGKFLTILWLCLGLVAFALGTMTSLILILNAPVLLPFDFGWKLIACSVLGATGGTALSVFAYLRPYTKKAVYLYLHSMLYLGAWYALEIPLFVPVEILYSILLLGLAFKKYLDAWNNAIVYVKRPSKYDLKIPLIIRERLIKKLAYAEWLFIVRNNEHVSILLVVIFAIAGQILALQVLPHEYLSGIYARYTYAGIAGTALYVAASMLSVISALSVVGKDTQAFWAIKTAPVSGENVMFAKTYWVLFTSMIALPIVLLALPIYMFRKIPLIIFVIVSGICATFVSTAVGTWGAARFPDFSTWYRGSTDIVTTYNVLMLALVLNVIFLGIPLQIYFFDKVLGILSAIFSADMGALLYVYACKLGGKYYDQIEK